MIELTCPHCASSLKIEEQYAGQRGRCNKCGGAIFVPNRLILTRRDFAIGAAAFGIFILAALSSVISEEDDRPANIPEPSIPDLTVLGQVASAEPTRWTAEKANAWYEEQDWLVGANFVPNSAINQIEMWQSDTFDVETIDRELGWAAEVGMNCMRVFLHDMVWAENPDAYYKRIDSYLDISAKHGIKTMLVLFDSVWDPHPRLGKQKDPTPGVHNSGWVQGPHIDVLKDAKRHIEMKPYVEGVMRRFEKDDRVLIWDLYNEPGNTNQNSYGEFEPANKSMLCRQFLENVLSWARPIGVSQPITVGAWQGMSPLDQFAVEQSDIITFHTYYPLDGVRKTVEELKSHGRPLICTEYMARNTGSRFDTILPYFKEQNVGAIHWGLVNGKSQTIYPWRSWQEPFEREPELWSHDVFRIDGSPYDRRETELIRVLTNR